MENINGVRRAAAELRAKFDPSLSAMSAQDVITAALDKCGLGFEEVGPDDPVLAKGLGVLKRRYLTIFVAKNLGPEMKVEVIAHEIGHFVVHLEEEVRIDKPYSAPGAGDPLQRVEAYSKKERREAQANAFARELLLPRSLARRLFKEGQRATQISRSLGLRMESTYQQLADSLLLPEPSPPVEKPTSTPLPLDPSQNSAANHIGSPFLLEAGPGTGKTKTMVERIVRLLDTKKAKADEILALTFSNKAAEEIAERVEGAVGSVAANIWTGTFHAFGLELLRKHHARFGLPSDPRLIDTSEAINLLEDTLPALPIVHLQNLFEPALALRDILRAVSRAKDELIGPDEYRKLADAMATAADRSDLDAVKAAEKAQEVALVYGHYQAILASRQAVDYGDLIMVPALMLQTDAQFRAEIADTFRWVHVDEYQDINRASAMLVKGIVGEGERLWVVGDARQSIYRFRGASSRNMARFTRDYSSGTKDRLGVNYRSTDPIVSLFSGFGKQMLVSAYALPLEIRPNRTESGTPPTTFVGSDPDQEMDFLAANIRELESQGVALRNQAVIARTNGTLARVGEELEARGIPILYLGPLFDRPEVRDLLSLLSLVVDDGSSLLRVGGLPEYGVGASDLALFVQAAKSQEMTVKDFLARSWSEAGISDNALRGLTLLAKHLSGFSQGNTPWLVLMEYLFDRSEYVAIVLSGKTPSDDMRRIAVRQLIEALRSMPLTGSQMPIARALQRVRHLVLLADERDLRRLPDEVTDLNGVQLMTIHGSKGLEFDAVHLPQMTKRAMPAPDRPDACPPPTGMIGDVVEVDAHAAEEECLFFVAMSRAKTHLRLYRPATASGKTSNPSTYLERLAVRTGAVSKPVKRVNPRKSLRPVPNFVFPETMSAADVESYERCGRRYFYERIARLGGASERSAYMEAHRCILSVVDAARSADQSLSPDEISVIFESAWNASSLPGHPFEAQYRALVDRMLGNLRRMLAGTSKAEPLSVAIDGTKVTVAPDFVRSGPTGRTLTVVRSGKRSTTEADRISHTLMLEAAEKVFGSRFELETFHIIEGTAGGIAQSDAKRRNRMQTAANTLAAIKQGLYPAVRSDFLCPRCRFFFICPAPHSDVA